MATLGELKTRIRLETNKDDIASGGEAEEALNTAIRRAIEYYADKDFWFNQTSDTATANAVTVARPASIRLAKVVAIGACKLKKVALADIQPSALSGEPTAYAEYGDSIWLYPIPGSSTVLTFYGTADLGVPADDSASNAWTTEGEDLICARAKLNLYRSLWRDTEGAMLAIGEEKDAYDSLLDETRKRMATPLRSTGDEPYLPAYYDIRTG